MSSEFPTLSIICNDKKVLDGYEIDIYIPSLKLGIEWNGVVHHKPIYGKKKLDRIQQIDLEKSIMCKSKEIELVVVSDLVSNDTKIKEAFFDISKIIRNKLSTT